MHDKHFFDMLEVGLEYQDFVMTLFYEMGLSIHPYSSRSEQYKKGENKAGIEIKHDRNFRKTGNLYIEIAEKSHASNVSFVSSGIYRNDNSWLYVIGDYDEAFIFGKNVLKSLHVEGRYRVHVGDTSKGMLLPVEYVRKNDIALRILTPKKEEECLLLGTTNSEQKKD